MKASDPNAGYKFQDCIPLSKKKNKDEEAYNQQRHEENYDSEDRTEYVKWVLLFILIVVILIIIYRKYFKGKSKVDSGTTTPGK